MDFVCDAFDEISDKSFGCAVHRHAGTWTEALAAADKSKERLVLPDVEFADEHAGEDAVLVNIDVDLLLNFSIG